jgi:hypothetical protein
MVKPDSCPRRYMMPILRRNGWLALRRVSRPEDWTDMCVGWSRLCAQDNLVDLSLWVLLN